MLPLVDCFNASCHPWGWSRCVLPPVARRFICCLILLSYSTRSGATRFCLFLSWQDRRHPALYYAPQCTSCSRHGPQSLFVEEGHCQGLHTPCRPATCPGAMSVTSCRYNAESNWTAIRRHCGSAFSPSRHVFPRQLFLTWPKEGAWLRGKGKLCHYCIRARKLSRVPKQLLLPPS